MNTKENESKCCCPQPYPETKCSENGIITYCRKCLKEYDSKSWNAKQ